MADKLEPGPRPKHVQLSDVLADLAMRDLGPGAAIPSERELMASYDVSRATVRKSIDSLVAGGLLEKIHGKGTFVARPRVETHLHLASFSDDMRRRGLVPSTRLMRVDEERPPPEVVTSLRLGAHGTAWRIDRVRLADGQPMAIEQGWYPRSLLPDLDTEDLTGSLYTLFAERHGLVIDAAEQTLWGESAEGATARRLEAAVHTPLLVFRRVSSAAGRPVEHVVSRYRGDRYQVHMSLGAAPGATGKTPSTTRRNGRKRSS
ncbi:GntR family transcriptional regulator [Nocardioides KLBMP 9356]|uniref:GntR family transcriptional regulator n=1 Tax=Nocardioides potassii TaxID=2911371 RepID=A0ABS9H8N4_9ACTN|nr:GntR family transcriptional regulator [Nocardioides potassii]MCF6376594.1 GntR family transcriptional regulator [Nocardioides potassii]